MDLSGVIFTFAGLHLLYQAWASYVVRIHSKTSIPEDFKMALVWDTQESSMITLTGSQKAERIEEYTADFDTTDINPIQSFKLRCEIDSYSVSSSLYMVMVIDPLGREHYLICSHCYFSRHSKEATHSVGYVYNPEGPMYTYNVRVELTTAPSNLLRIQLYGENADSAFYTADTELSSTMEFSVVTTLDTGFIWKVFTSDFDYSQLEVSQVDITKIDPDGTTCNYMYVQNTFSTTWLEFACLQRSPFYYGCEASVLSIVLISDTSNRCSDCTVLVTVDGSGSSMDKTFSLSGSYGEEITETVISEPYGTMIGDVTAVNIRVFGSFCLFNCQTFEYGLQGVVVSDNSTGRMYTFTCTSDCLIAKDQSLYLSRFTGSTFQDWFTCDLTEHKNRPGCMGNASHAAIESFQFSNFGNGETTASSEYFTTDYSDEVTSSSTLPSTTQIPDISTEEATTDIPSTTKIYLPESTVKLESDIMPSSSITTASSSGHTTSGRSTTEETYLQTISSTVTVTSNGHTTSEESFIETTDTQEWSHLSVSSDVTVLHSNEHTTDVRSFTVDTHTEASSQLSVSSEVAATFSNGYNTGGESQTQDTYTPEVNPLSVSKDVTVASFNEHTNEEGSHAQNTDTEEDNHLSVSSDVTVASFNEHTNEEGSHAQNTDTKEVNPLSVSSDVTVASFNEHTTEGGSPTQNTDTKEESHLSVSTDVTVVSSNQHTIEGGSSTQDTDTKEESHFSVSSDVTVVSFNEHTIEGGSSTQDTDTKEESHLSVSSDVTVVSFNEHTTEGGSPTQDTDTKEESHLSVSSDVTVASFNEHTNEEGSHAQNTDTKEVNPLSVSSDVTVASFNEHTTEGGSPTQNTDTKEESHLSVSTDVTVVSSNQHTIEGGSSTQDTDTKEESHLSVSSDVTVVSFNEHTTEGGSPTQDTDTKEESHLSVSSDVTVVSSNQHTIQDGSPTQDTDTKDGSHLSVSSLNAVTYGINTVTEERSESATNTITPISQYTESDRRCSDFPTVEHAVITQTNSTVLVTCSSGLVFPDGTLEFTSTCENGVEWNPKPWPSCYYYICPIPPIVQNTLLIVSGRTEGYKAQYSCVEGHMFEDGSETKQAVCQNLIWTGVPDPCQAVYCSPSIYTSNADTEMNDHIYQSAAVITCHQGFKFSDGTKSRSVVCQKDGTWSINQVHCHAVQCFVDTQESPMYLDELAMLFCRSSQTTFDTGLQHHAYQCTESYHIPLCTGYYCPTLQYLPNSRVETIDNTYALFTCHDGYRFLDGKKQVMLNCRDSSVEVGRGMLQCLEITCPPSPNIHNGIANTSLALYGTFVGYNCSYGYEFPDHSTNKTIQCTDHGNWSATVEDCREILCPDLSQLSIVAVSSIKRMVGSEVKVTCGDGTRFFDGYIEKNISCLSNGQWNQLVTSCHADRCPPQPVVENAESNTQGTDYGTAVEFACNKGFYVSLSLKQETKQYIECLTDGSWNTQPQDCKKISCPVLPILPHTEPVEFTAVYEYGDVISITCSSGFLFSDGTVQQSAFCDEHGHWQINNTKCHRIDCGPPGSLSNGSVVYTSTLYGDTATTYCQQNHWLESLHQSSQTAVCSDTGEWKPQVTDCVEVTCSPLATWLGLHVNTSQRTVQTIVSVSCAQGFSMVDTRQTNISIYCLPDGTWSAQIQCTAISLLAGIESTPAEAEMASTIGLFSLVVVLVVAVLVVMSDLHHFMQLVHILITTNSSMSQYIVKRFSESKERLLYRRSSENPCKHAA